MELVSVRIEKYRSIQRSAEMSFDGLKVLIGANNRGKSNVLNAIRLGMDTLERAAILPLETTKKAALLRNRAIRPSTKISSRTHNRPEYYEWQRDFPVHLRGHRGRSQESKVRFDFRLSEEDRKEFFKTTGARNGGDLAVELIFDSAQTKISFPKKGGSTYAHNAQAICDFICSRIKFLYIPAIRTPDQAVNVIEQLIADQMSTLESNSRYRELESEIQEMLTDRLDEVSKNLDERMKTYLPGFQQLDVKTRSHRTTRINSMPVDDIQIHDGVLTSLLEKGDGVKSLVTLALLHDLAERGPSSQEVLLAIDEPEAHLHPEAIHDMADVLRKIARDKPVVIATHSQMLINREDLRHNLIVDVDTFEPVKRIEEIRKCLGIRPFDNLTTAEFVILTEGPTDVQVVTTFLCQNSTIFNTAWTEGAIAVADTNGAGNVPARVQFALSMLSEVFVILDKDQAGTHATESLQRSLFDMGRVRQLSIPGRSRSELEDLVAPELLQVAFKQVTGQELTTTGALAPGSAWGDRTKRDLDALGLLDSHKEKVILDLKKEIAKLVAENVSTAFTAQGEVVLNSIRIGVEKMITRQSGVSKLNN